MGEINFYLKDTQKSKCIKKSELKKTPIYLQFKYSGIRFKYYFGQSINPDNWNYEKQRVKSNKQTTSDGEHSLNDLLDNLERVINTTYRKELSNGIPPKSKLKEALDQFIYQNTESITRPTLYTLAQRFIEGEIKNREGEDKSYHTTKVYKTVLNHLKEFEKSERYPVDFGSINLDFYRKYINYLGKVSQRRGSDGKIKRGLAQNTRAKHIQVIKTWMNEALDLKYTINAEFKNKKFTASWKEVDAVYLTEKELINLYKHDFSKNKRLEQVRDLFVFGSFVGLRYSDYSTVKPENIIEMDSVEGKSEYYIRMITIKTGNLVIIPCNPVVLKIFEKYSHNRNKLPNAPSNQKFNDYIKEVCKEAKLTVKGRLPSEPDKELWECISSHTARRSFATNLYLEGFPVIDLMRITGHKTESSFMKYIRHTKLDAAKRLNDHMRKQWSAKLLKVA